jgi:transmembrane sensor
MSPSGNILNFPDRSPIEEEASRWVVRHDKGALTPEERTQFEAWKAASPANAEAFARLSGHWNDLDLLAALADTPTEKPLLKRPAVWAGVGMAAAAAFAIFIGVNQLLTAEYTTPNQIAQIPGLDVYATQVGDQEKITLEDGSVVTLNTASRVETRMNAQERTVRLLEGEAYFEVAHDPSRPFRVYAGDGMTVAVGTAFSVRLKKDAVEVVVSEGKVAYSRVTDAPTADPIAFVVAGQTANFSDAVVIEKIDEAVVDRKLSWTEGQLVFAGDPLSSVVADIARYTDIQFDFASQELADMRVGGVFQVGEVNDMLDAIETNFGLQVERIGEQSVRISGAAN